MFSSVLVANRGEIACRVIRTAKRLGLRTIAVHSEADAGALHVDMADEAHLIGPAPAGESYLRIDRIIEVATRTGAECIHPGYGFLSERAEFADACASAGIVFVGPPASAIRAMGLKDAAKALAQKAGVPVVPGYHGTRQEPEFLRQKAYEVGYPVLIKAVAGGGGKGMRRVDRVADFELALQAAQREAQGAFGDPRVLVEKYVLAPRHIEIQVFGDAHGNVVHLFERDCSLQRRHQKVIEEAPAPGMTEDMRSAMGKAAVEAARAVGYIGAGTVEFIADGREGLRADRFYFMEMNTRLQVEHPVTEAITGLDLVELQFRVAGGETLPFGQDDLAIDGHAVEVRLYAEDPERGFLPSTGTLRALRLPDGEGVRVDAGVRRGDEVTPFYDPMIAKVIAHGPTRSAALERLSGALAITVVAGPKTNASFLKRLCDAEAFRAGRFDTGFIDRLEPLAGTVGLDGEAVATGILCLLDRQRHGLDREAKARSGWSDDPWTESDAFDLGGGRTTGLNLVVDGETVEAALVWADLKPAVTLPSLGFAGAPNWAYLSTKPGERDLASEHLVVMDGEAALVLARGRQTRVEFYDPFSVDLEHMDEGGLVKAPMHGKVVAVLVRPGDRVKKGQRLAIVEAMKMEHVLTAPSNGEVAEVAAEAGAQVAEGARLIVLKAGDE